MARVEVPMPQLGESITEGTVLKWLKQVGENVQRDEPLLSISTDKVDAEIPSPVAGRLVEAVAKEGETIGVGAVLAWVETDVAATDREASVSDEASGAETDKASDMATDMVAAERAVTVAGASVETPARDADEELAEGDDTERRPRGRSSPLVKRIAAEHGVDISTVPGTGRDGRVTKDDLLAFVAQRAASKPAEVPADQASVAEPAVMGAEQLWGLFYGQVRHPEFPVRPADRVEQMDRVRRLTADHMVLAKRIAPHVHSFIEVDFSAIDAIRRAGRQRWEEQGVGVSYTAFVAWAVARTLRDFPTVNATISGERIVFRGDVNIGIAVDLNPGLIVPVVRQADELNLLGLARRLIDLAERARSRKLKPDEIQGATFSITNPGVLGTIVGMPIIPEGTAAILGLGAVEKRLAVMELGGADVIAIRKRAFFSLGYDHRLVDGADAARFLSQLKHLLEDFPEDAA